MDAYRLCYTPISAVVQPIEEMSKEAVRILMEMIEGGEKRIKYEHVELEVDFVYRASCL